MWITLVLIFPCYTHNPQTYPQASVVAAFWLSTLTFLKLNNSATCPP
ncbi:hypothetical protein LSAJ18_20026 [Latilactobacillus sakei]|nr:hypothetical protein LSAJ18_20026 [Latilactobacillus sakei]